MPKVTKEQTEITKKIHDLMQEVFGKDYWKPQRGDFCGFTLIDFVGIIVDEHDHLIYVSQDGECPEWKRKEDFFPIPSWADCRVVLREMGWLPSRLQENALTGEVRALFLNFNDATLDNINISAPDDHTAIMEVLSEALKRRLKEQARTKEE